MMSFLTEASSSTTNDFVFDIPHAPKVRGTTGSLNCNHRSPAPKKRVSAGPFARRMKHPPMRGAWHVCAFSDNKLRFCSLVKIAHRGTRRQSRQFAPFTWLPPSSDQGQSGKGEDLSIPFFGEQKSATIECLVSLARVVRIPAIRLQPGKGLYEAERKAEASFRSEGLSDQGPRQKERDQIMARTP